MISNPDATYWLKWLDKNKIEEIEPWVFFFLPIMHKTFQELKLEHPSLNIIRGVYKKSIYRNQLFIRELLKLNSALKAKGIEPIFLTELSIYFRDPSQPRYLKNVDVFLPKRQEVYDILRELNWYKVNAITFGNSIGFRLLVEWERNSSAILRQYKREYKIKGENSIILIPDELVLVLLFVSSSRAASRVSISWVHDSIELLNSSRFIDWEKVLTQSRNIGSVLDSNNCLTFLQRINFSSIPVDYGKALKPGVSDHFRFNLFIPILSYLRCRTRWFIRNLLPKCL
jgi:hypothetical protein